MNPVKLLSLIPPRFRLYLATAIYGLVGGGMAVLFHQSIHWFHEKTLVTWSKQGGWTFALCSLLLILFASLLSGWLVNHKCPEAAGSGIPQLKLAFWKDFGWMSPRIIWIKLIAGVVSIGGGLSLGREGPSVQLAGVAGSWTAARLGIAKQRHRMPAAAAAAAGLAAAFNTPLAAVTFVLEEIIGDLNSRFLGNILMAAVIGALVAHGLLGDTPAFQLTIQQAPSWLTYTLTPLVAVCATCVGLGFQSFTLKLRSWSKQERRFPNWLLPACAALLTWVLAMLVWLSTGHLGVFGLGYEDLSQALTGDLSWKIAALLLLTKFLATSFCYGLGGCGGIFSPTLFLGAMAGLATAGVVNLALPLESYDYGILAVVGMCSCLGAVVRAPVTGILIVFEMTHQFSLVLPLMLAALISQSLSRWFIPHNLYDSVLEQDGHHLDRIAPPRDLESWQQLPASTIGNFYPVTIEDSSPDALKALLAKHPYRYFPISSAGSGEEGHYSLVSRSSVEKAILSSSLIKDQPAINLSPEKTIQELQTALIQSGSSMVLLTDSDRRIIGLVTLHDLLRAQMAYGSALER